MRKTKEHYEKSMYGCEPEFEYEGVTDIDYFNWQASNWYAANASPNKKKDWVVAFMNAEGYTDDAVKCVESVDFSQIPSWVAMYCRMITRGCRMQAKWQDSLKKKLSELIYSGLSKANSKATTDEPNIQDWIKEKVAEFGGDLAVEIDKQIASLKKNPSSPITFDIKKWITERGIKPLHANRLVEGLQDDIKELTKTVNKSDEQLVEGYSYLSDVQIRNLLKFYNFLVQNLNGIKENAKLFKAPRKKRTVPPVKQIAKLKYKANHPTYGVSIPPSNLVGSVTAFLFNTETRALIEFNAAGPAGFSVKGTTLLNVESSKCYSKTIRKPEEVLPVIRKEGKRAINAYVKEIKAVEKPVKNRVNEHMIILRVF